jgi:Na+/melibiose symporter-like transporter
MKKDTLGRKLAFASADIFGGGSFNIINFLYPGFLALTVGISPFWISLVLLVARVWDAITDPLMGFISDRTKSRFGKRRIYLIVASPLIVVSMYLLFFPFQFSSEILRVIAVLGSYIVFTTVQTMVMIPYYSLSSEVAFDYNRRAAYNSYRLGFSIFSSIICVAVPGIIVNSFGDTTIGYQVMSLSFGLIFGLSVLLSGLFTKEEITSAPLTNKLEVKAFIQPLQLKPFRQYLYLLMLLQTSMAVISGLFFFYADFYLTRSATLAGESTIVGLVSAALMFAMQIVALPIYLKLIGSKGKMFVYQVGALLWILVALALFFIPADVNPPLIFAMAALIGFGISGPGLVPHTMYGDVVDAGQVLFNERLEGQMSGFSNFLSKVAQAVGLAGIMFVLGLAGFKEQVPGAAKIVSQPDSALLAIRIVISLAPLLLMGSAILISRQYKIDAKKQAEIKAYLNKESKVSKEDLLRTF